MKGDSTMCAHNHHHESLCQVELSRLPMDTAEDLICDLADLFKVFGDTTRMRIMYALLSGELCVCEISEKLCMTSSAISHQLKVLKQNNLVANRREGKTIYYFLADDHVRTIVSMGAEHLLEKGEE